LLREKGTFPREQCSLLGERFKFFRETYVPNFFVITIISFFKYFIVTYRWKGLKENYNFVDGNISLEFIFKNNDKTKF